MTFKNLKTVMLELRPVYHKTDDRIKAHIFLVMLAYYLQWHAMQRLQPLFDKDEKGNDRRWTFEIIVERLKSIRKAENLKLMASPSKHVYQLQISSNKPSWISSNKPSWIY